MSSKKHMVFVLFCFLNQWEDSNLEIDLFFSGVQTLYYTKENPKWDISAVGHGETCLGPLLVS